MPPPPLTVGGGAPLQLPPPSTTTSMPPAPGAPPASSVPVDNSKRDGPFKCELCFNGYMNPGDLKLHKSRRHPETETAAVGAAPPPAPMISQPPAIAAQPPPVARPPPQAVVAAGPECVRALADFDAQVPDDLSFRKGDIIVVLQRFDSWIQVLLVVCAIYMNLSSFF